MRQLAEDLALPVEAFYQLLAVGSCMGQLESQWALDRAIAATCPPDRTHTTATDLLLDDVRADDGARHDSRDGGTSCRFQIADLGQREQKITGLGGGMLPEQLAQLVPMDRICGRQRIEPPLESVAGHVQGFVEETRQRGPLHRIDFHGATS